MVRWFAARVVVAALVPRVLLFRAKTVVLNENTKAPLDFRQS